MSMRPSTSRRGHPPASRATPGLRYILAAAQGHLWHDALAKTLKPGGGSYVIEKASTARRMARGITTMPSRNDILQTKLTPHQSTNPVENDVTIRVVDATLQPVGDAIEDQCTSLLNVLSAIDCMSIAIVTEAADPAPEMSAAFKLLEAEIRQVIAGLQQIAGRGATLADHSTSNTTPTHGMIGRKSVGA